jgi:hypothetical protein
MIKGGAFNLYANKFGEAAKELEMIVKSSGLSNAEIPLKNLLKNLENPEIYYKKYFA